MRRVGLFGGTFDPPHLGHLAIAEWAREQLGLERVVFMPAGAPPHKRRRGLSRAEARIAMTRLAVKGQPAFTVSTLETRRRGPSFTVETLRALKTRHPRARLYLVIGADSLDDFANWHAPREILELATLAVAKRSGSGRSQKPAITRRGAVVWLDNPVIALSSSMIRLRAAAGCSIRYLVPDAVARYIARHHLYGEKR